MAKNKPWYEEPERKFVARRSPEEHAAVAAAIETLPAEHQARQAFADGVDTIALTHLVSGDTKVRDALCAAYIEASARLLSAARVSRRGPGGTAAMPRSSSTGDERL